MAPYSELEQVQPGTLPADFGDWDGGTPPATLPTDFEGFDDWAAAHEVKKAAAAPAELSHSNGSENGEMECAICDAQSLAKVERSGRADGIAQETDGAILSVPESGGGGGRMTIIALGLILLLAAGVVLYYSLRPSSRKATASPSHSASEVLARTSHAGMQVKVAEADSSDALVLNAASGMQAETVVPVVPAESKSESPKNPPNRSQSKLPASTARRDGRS